MSQSEYIDTDFVYVDPETRLVVGKVEWGKNGLPKPKKYIFVEKESPKTEPVEKPVKGEKKKRERRSGSGRKYYPWGSYKSMKRIYKVEGKIKEAEPNRTLEEVLPKALNEPFWD